LLWCWYRLLLPHLLLLTIAITVITVTIALSIMRNLC
jgi:hypothetical protein